MRAGDWLGTARDSPRVVVGMVCVRVAPGALTRVLGFAGCVVWGHALGGRVHGVIRPPTNIVGDDTKE